MKIRRLRVAGFGQLKGDFIFSSDRCNLILQPNESGKSTLAAAILAALYGFPRQRTSRDRPIVIKERFRPWRGEAFGLQLELDCRDRFYVIRRDFHREAVWVLDGQTGKEITEEFSKGKDQLDFGEAITGLSREDFSRCCFVGQREIEGLRDAETLTHALQRIATSQKGDVAAGEALAALARATDRDFEGMKLGKGKVDTEIKRLDKEIEELRGELQKIAARRRESEEKIRRLEQAAEKEGRAESDLTRIDYLQLLAAKQEVTDAIGRLEGEKKDIQQYRDELASLGPYAGFPAEKLGELRELKGRVDLLEERRRWFERRLLEELEAPAKAAEQELIPLSSFGALSAQQVERVSDKLAVLNDLWALRRQKRRALRHEKKRLEGSGLDTERLRELTDLFAGIDPQDRRFIAGYKEKVLEAKTALIEAERNRERLVQAEGGESPALVSLASARRAETFALATGFTSIALTFILWFTLSSKLPTLLLLLLGGASFVYWIRLHEKRPVPGAEEFGSDLQRTQTQMWAREKELVSLQDRLASLASRTGRARPEQLIEEHRELEHLQQLGAPAAALAASLREIWGRYAAASEELADLMDRAGRPAPSERVTPRMARRFREELGGYLHVRDRVEALRAELEAGVKELAEVVLEIETLRDDARKILSSAMAGEEPIEDLAAALERFEQSAGRRERFDRLSTEILPAAERRRDASPEERAASLTKDHQILSRQIEKCLAQNPELSGLTPQRSSREYAEERRRIQEEARATQKERLALSEELGDVLKEYRRDYPGRQALLARLETARERAIAFRDAVAIASQVLTAISRDAYAEWAVVLNERTGEILKRLNPNYQDVLFDTDLSFTIQDARSGERLDRAAVDLQLSSGARDQVYLAVRMAASEYLSASGVRLPFILDDPFASFDDERFERAMEFLLDTLGRRHQIVLMSCHEERHQRWLERSAAIRGDRVRVLGRTPLTT